MASAIKKTFKDLRGHTCSLILQLLQTESKHSELILGEIRTFSSELDSIWACHIVGDSDVCSPTASARNNRSSSPSNIKPTSSSHSNNNSDAENDRADSIFAQATYAPSQRQQPFINAPNPSSPRYSPDNQDSDISNIRHSIRIQDILGPDTDTNPPRHATNDQSPRQHSPNLATSLPPSLHHVPLPSTGGIIDNYHVTNEPTDLGFEAEQHERGSAKRGGEEVGKEAEQQSREKGEESCQQRREEEEVTDNLRSNNGRSNASSLEGCSGPGESNGRGRQLRQRKEVGSSAQAQMVESTKRKAGRQPLRNDSSKRSKTQSTVSKRNFISFKELECIPQDVIQPTEVYQLLANRSGCDDQNLLWLLTRLFFAIASPDAFYQLRDACAIIRQNGEPTVPQYANTVAQTIEALDMLDTAASTNTILRRYHLARLVDHRNELEHQHKTQKQKRTTRGSGYAPVTLVHEDRSARPQEGYGRASSMALVDLMTEAYPGLKQPLRHRAALGTEYKRKHKSLKNRLNSGRNWHLMQQQFSSGVLALVPIGGDYSIQNYEVEKLPVSVFTTFLDVLDECRGDFLRKVSEMVSRHIHDILYRRDLSWKYVFERMDGDSLKSEPLDSPGFIQFCELEG